MRFLTAFILLILCLSCGGSKNANKTSLSLNGTRVPVRQELAGKQWPPSMFEKQQLIIAGNKYTLTAESVDQGELAYKKGKMDIYGKEGVNAGKHFPAIYKYENGQLTICYNLAGDSYPEAFETKSGPLLFLSVFKRAGE